MLRNRYKWSEMFMLILFKLLFNYILDQCPFNKTNINCTLDCRCVPQQYEACYTNGTCMCYSVLTVDGAPKGKTKFFK